MHKSYITQSKLPISYIFLNLLEASEALLGSCTSRDDTQDIESHGLRQRPALTNGNSVAFVAAEARGDMRRNVGVTFLVTLVLLDVMQVVTADNNCAVHLCALHLAGEDTAADRYIASKRTLLIDVVAFNGLLRGLETQTNGLIPPGTTFAWGLATLLGRLLVSAERGRTEEKKMALEICEDEIDYMFAPSPAADVFAATYCQANVRGAFKFSLRRLVAPRWHRSNRSNVSPLNTKSPPQFSAIFCNSTGHATYHISQPLELTLG